MEDIIRHVDQNFCRLRLGIGAPPQGWKVPDYVLSRFRDEESVDLEQFITRAANAALCWAEEGIQEAMNKYNVAEAAKQKNEKDNKKKSEKLGEQPESNMSSKQKME